MGSSYYHVNRFKSRSKKNVTFGQDKIFLVDFGANGNFINSKAAFDPHSVVPVTDSQVFFPDESGAVSKAVGTFCGEKSHLLPSLTSPCCVLSFLGIKIALN